VERAAEWRRGYARGGDCAGVRRGDAAGIRPRVPAGEGGYRKRHCVQPVPGASARWRRWRLRAANRDIRFCGFLPHKPGQRAKALEARRKSTPRLSSMRRRIAFWKHGGHRESAGAAARRWWRAAYQDPRGVSARHSGGDVARNLEARDAVKGEMTVLIGRAAAPAPDDTPVDEAVAR